MSDNKTHYRKVFKSDHLGQADIEEYQEAGSNLVFTIVSVKQEYGVTVAGRKGDYNIAYFQEKIKPMVLNAGNSKIVRSFAGGSPFIEDWNMPLVVQIYADPSVRMKGETTGGLKIHPKQPQVGKVELTKDKEVMWNNAKAAYLRDGNFDAVLKRCDISDANKSALIAECSQAVNEDA